MERIASIENYFNIKFRLPQKATEEDYLAIDVLSDSMSGKKNRIIPPIPMKKPGFHHRLDLNEEVYIGNGDRLLRLVFFGYTFKPIAQYILPGKYVWKGGLKAWQSKQYSGIPVRVEFEVSYDAGKETDLIRYVFFDVFKDEFADEDIPMLEGDIAAFFEEYTKLCYLTQKNWRLYLNYKDSWESLIDTA